MREPLRALIVEDKPDDAELLAEELERGGYEVEWSRVWIPAAFEQQLETPWDVILADFQLPEFSARHALELLKQANKDIPLIIVSGSVTEDIAVEAMRAGAHDFFAKTNLARLAAAVAREVREARMRHERKDAFERLRQAEERYRLIVESVKDYAIFMLSQDARVTTWNGGAERITGYREDEIIGRDFSGFFRQEEQKAGVPGQIIKAARTSGSIVNEGWRVKKDGSLFWAECTTDVIREQDVLLGFSQIIRDTSERKRLIDELKHAVHARDEFLSIASHELRTPLTSLQLQLQSLEGFIEKSEQRVSTKLDRATRSTERLTRLVEMLLDVSRIEMGRLRLNLEVCDVAEVVADAVERARPELERSACPLVLHIWGPLQARVDRLRLEQVLTNLLSNALKYGAGKPIEVGVRREDANAYFWVKDQGIGIAPEDLSRVFGRFERAVSIRHYGGLGLGLYVTRQIVDAHAGNIQVESKPGRGTNVVIQLPLAARETLKEGTTN